MEASTQSGLSQSDLQLLKDKIVLFLSKEHYTDNTQADKDLNVSLVKKCSAAFEEKINQAIKSQPGRYCPSGHLMYKTTYNSSSLVDSNIISDATSECKECNETDWGFPYGWRCEVPECFMICLNCYTRKYGRAAANKYGQVWRYYDKDFICHENSPNQQIKPAICKQGHILYKFPLKKTIDKKDRDFERYKEYYYGTTKRKCTYCQKECLNYQWRCNDLSHGRMCDDCLNKVFGAEQSKIQEDLSRNDYKIDQSQEESKISSTSIPKCKSNHVLVQLKGKIYPPTQQHNCSGCNTENIDSSQCFWNCYKCSFDLCQSCAVQQYGEQILVKPKPKKATFDSVTRTVGCEKGHILVRTTGSFPDIRKQVDCCLCAKFCLERDPYYWRCHDCKYDICHSCFKKNQINIESDPQGKIARKAQKERNYRNIFMESLEKVNKEDGYFYRIDAKGGYKLDCTEFLLAGVILATDFGLNVYVKQWTQVFIEVLIDQIKLKDGKIREEMIGLCIYNQFLLTAQRAMAGKIQISSRYYTMKEVSILLLSKIATIFEKALTTVIEKNSDFKIKTPAQPCYFASQVYDKGDLDPYLAPFLTKEKPNIVKIAAEKAIPLQYKFNPQIIQLLGQFSIKGKPIYAQCKYGKKISDVYLDYNHGIRRSEMKYLEELASKPENDFKSIASMRDYIIQTDIVDAEALINEYFIRMQNWIKYILNNEPVYQYDGTQINQNNPVKTFCQQDILRCKAYFGSVDDIIATIDSIKQQFPLVRIKNRMGFLGDVMVNFWYEDFVAEAQLVYFEENEGEDDHAMKLRNKVNHFMYEIVRNPLGPLVHCAELTFKEAISRLGFDVIRQFGILNNIYRTVKKIKSAELPLHILPDGTEYYGSFKDGQKDGKCKEYLPDGTYFEGEYKDGMKNGNGIIETLDGTVFSGRFSQDQKTQGNLMYSNGFAIEGGYFENGVRNSKFRVYLKGVMYGEVQYVNDKPEGQVSFRHIKSLNRESLTGKSASANLLAILQMVQYVMEILTRAAIGTINIKRLSSN